jgi:maleylpyruvate isomerase
MDAALRRLSDELDAATQRLLDEARLLTRSDLKAPSLLPDWSRAHVLAHLARSADAMRNLLAGARAGQDRPGYASPQAREADIEVGAAAEAKDLADDLAASAMAFRTVARQLPDQAWDYRVLMPDGMRLPARALLTWRLAEVELHHCDLGIGYGYEQWGAAFAEMELGEPLRSRRAERVDYAPTESVRDRSKARKVPPYRPSQPLPGSWIGRRPG